MSFITAERVVEFSEKFTGELAIKYKDEHVANCHHWDYTFVLWHRKFVTKFWNDINMPRFYFMPWITEQHQHFRNLTQSIDSNNRIYHDRNKFVLSDDSQIRFVIIELVEALFCETFALDLDHVGSNRSNNGFYNMSFSSQLEQLHDMIHGMTGTAMRNVGTAGGDACFFIHHTFVDLVFEYWRREYNKELPISEDHFLASQELQEIFPDGYKELQDLWNVNYYEEEDFIPFQNLQENITMSLLKFDNIQHRDIFRTVRVWDGTQVIANFSVFTGGEDNCITCKQKTERGHASSFPLVGNNFNIRSFWFNINNRWYDYATMQNAFANVGMSRPYIIIT